MKKFRNILYIFVFAGNLFGQTLTVDLDPIGNVVVGGGLNISGRVTHDGVSPTDNSWFTCTARHLC